MKKLLTVLLILCFLLPMDSCTNNKPACGTKHQKKQRSHKIKKNTSFKTYDKSGSGNHGNFFESEEIKSEKSVEFNKIGRPAKIV